MPAFCAPGYSLPPPMTTFTWASSPDTRSFLYMQASAVCVPCACLAFCSPYACLSAFQDCFCASRTRVESLRPEKQSETSVHQYLVSTRRSRATSLLCLLRCSSSWQLCFSPVPLLHAGLPESVTDLLTRSLGAGSSIPGVSVAGVSRGLKSCLGYSERTAVIASLSLSPAPTRRVSTDLSETLICFQISQSCLCVSLWLMKTWLLVMRTRNFGVLFTLAAPAPQEREHSYSLLSTWPLG